MIAELAQAKFARPADGKSLLDTAKLLVSGLVPATLDQEVDLVRRCFSPDTLGELAAIRNRILSSRSQWQVHLKWALLATLREHARVKVGWPHQRPAIPRHPTYREPIRRFLARVANMGLDLDSRGSGDGIVLVGDSRNHTSWRSVLGRSRADACISSPPYLNNFDYADATRLELYFWGFARTWGEMCKLVRAGMVTATTQQSSLGQSNSAVRRLARSPRTHRWVADLTHQLSEARRAHGPGSKRYDRVLPAYFADMSDVLRLTYRHIKPGAKCAWVIGDSAPYGVYLDTPSALMRLAEDLGFVSLSDVVLRSRGLRWRSNGMRHKVPLAERLIVFERPNHQARPRSPLSV